MGRNKPIELIRLHINSLQGFWGSFSRKMNADKGDLSRIRKGSGEARTTGGEMHFCTQTQIPAHGTCEGFHDRRTGTRACGTSLGGPVAQRRALGW